MPTSFALRLPDYALSVFVWTSRKGEMNIGMARQERPTIITEELVMLRHQKPDLLEFHVIEDVSANKVNFILRRTMSFFLEKNTRGIRNRTGEVLSTTIRRLYPEIDGVAGAYSVRTYDFK
jgi:hypothetical protein